MARTPRTPKNAHEAQLVAIDTLKPYPGNARTHDLDVIRESLRVNTQYRPIVVRTQTRHVLAGNGTLEAAKAEGWSEVWATFIDCDAKAARRINLVDNRANDLAGWDEQLLAAQLGELPGVEGSGWSERELVSFVAKVNGPGEDTEPSEPPKVPRTNVGDLWTLGEHRLLCGDATVAGDVERLMDGAVAQMVCADPPYNVDYRGGTNSPDVGKIKLTRTDAYPDKRADYGGWLQAALTSAHDASDKKAALHVWHATIHVGVVIAAMTAAGWTQRALIVWDKGSIKGGLSQVTKQYRNQFEPMLYCHKRGQTPRWYGPGNESDIWSVAGPIANPLHPTTKPTALYERSLGNHSEPGDIVLECFGGSGTTIMAAENLSRRCYAMEIDPGYCDVIVDRWESHTGRTAVLHGTE